MGERRISLEGAVNFRDLGGYATRTGGTTRWGRVFRSDSLTDLTEADHSRLRDLGIRAVFDFRLPDERGPKPNRLPEDGSIQEHYLPFQPEGVLVMLEHVNAGRWGAAEIEPHVRGLYREFPTTAPDAYRTLLDHILEGESLPLVFHCTSGKDRTGLMAAIILLALDVPRETIVADYRLTNQYRKDIVGHLVSGGITRETMEMLTAARPGYIEAAFDGMEDEFGSTDAYLEKALGLTEAERARLKDLLVER